MSSPQHPICVARPDDPAWDEWLAPVRHDIYHTAGFHSYASGSDEGDAFLVVVGNRDRGLAWPYLLRDVSTVPGLEGSRATDVNSVYGYPGPIAWGCEPGDPFLASAFSQIVGVWRDQRAIAAFTRFHPLLGNAELMSGLAVPPPGEDGTGGVTAGGMTVSVDLRQGLAAARAAYAKDLSRDIRRLRRAGMTTVHDLQWDYLSAFARLYRDTMIRSRANEYYFFDEDDFRRLRAALGGRLHLFVTLLGDEVAAGGLFTEFGDIVQSYLVGTAAAHHAQSPSKLLYDDAVAWAHERNSSVLHLGGGRGGREDTLLWFKGRFSPRRHPFHTGRWVLDRRAYGAAVRARMATMIEGGHLEAGYFPAYRAATVTRDGRQVRGASWPDMDVRQITMAERDALAELLPRIDTTYFRPHPMTSEEATRIAGHQGRDVYLIGFADGSPVAYGMLRGWDEGYAVPSLGIGVRRDVERRGYGRAMMRRLHDVARARGASHVRLRVHADNVGAAGLYRSLGYDEVGVERSEILMILAL